TRGRCGQSIILTLRVSVLGRGAQAWSAYRCAAGFLSGLSRLWVISGGDGREDVTFHVRFTPESGHSIDGPACLLGPLSRRKWSLQSQRARHNCDTRPDSKILIIAV